ncbi:MAG TPA: type II toxin-antitoxin system RelE/ParE family toxin [Candidatus Binatia bacterium]|jgi:phage-related protein|nr:type II toxin-antitoxin system RelE/ParE family toxin [Candidatus Binatia bacterium]
MADKPLVWLGSSLNNVRAFPDEARQEAGFQLRRVQKGLSPSDWKPMTTVGAGVIEIRIHTTEEYRVFYVAKFAEAVYVLHAFTKQTQKTPQHDIDLAQRRYAELVRTRSKRKEK